MLCTIWYHLLVRENNSWRSITLSKVASFILLDVTLFHGCFSRHLNCTNAAKSPNASHVIGFNVTKRIFLDFFESQRFEEASKIRK